jgi:hypothetical protein
MLTNLELLPLASRDRVGTDATLRRRGSGRCCTAQARGLWIDDERIDLRCFGLSEPPPALPRDRRFAGCNRTCDGRRSAR